MTSQRLIDVSTTLADVVNGWPELAAELERRGLDYCCGGARTIEDACSSAGLDPASTVVELGAAAERVERTGAPDWTTMPAEELIDHLVETHHAYLWAELPRVTALLDKIVTVHGERHPELTDVAACFGRIRADLEPHMLKEEQVLFPMVRELAASDEVPAFDCGSLQNPISVMLREHDVVGEMLAELRELTGGYTVPADGCASYQACFAALAGFEADTHLHVHKENNLLFPMIVQMEQERTAAGLR
jgi:regulator of cell morphogenesis and NO signaling